MQASISLQKIDQNTKKYAVIGSHKVPSPAPYKIFLIAFFLTPCVLMEALFVPLLGIILATAVLWSATAYLRLVAQYKLYTAALAGVCTSGILISLTSNLIKTYGEFPMYVLLGLGTGINIACWIWFTGAKFTRLEKGLALYEQSR